MYDMLNKPTRFQIFSLKKISKVLQVVITSHYCCLLSRGTAAKLNEMEFDFMLQVQEPGPKPAVAPWLPLWVAPSPARPLRPPSCTRSIDGNKEIIPGPLSR